MNELQKFRRTAAWKRMRNVVMREEETCAICDLPVDKTLPPRTPASPEVDHIIPLKLGGHPLERSNLRLMHKLCNQKKGDRILRPGEVQQIKDQVLAQRYDAPIEDWSVVFGE